MCNKITPSITQIRGQRNSLREPHRCIPVQLMRNNEDGQIKQAQNKQWKVNKAAAAVQMLISTTGAFGPDLDIVFLQWGRPPGLYLAQITTVAFKDALYGIQSFNIAAKNYFLCKDIE